MSQHLNETFFITGCTNFALFCTILQIYEAELDAEKNLTNHAERKDFICRKYSDLTFTSSKYHDVIMESSKFEEKRFRSSFYSSTN